MEGLLEKIKQFNKERDWEQYHTPKNLAMALIVEVAEIAELFQWESQENSFNLSSNKYEMLKNEIGDTMIYVLSLCDKFGINPIEAAEEKLLLNSKKYPIDKVKGKSLKYNEYYET